MRRPISRSLRRWLTYLNLGITVSYLFLLFYAARQGLLWRADFTAYYTGAILVREGHASRLYDMTLQKEIQREILGERSFYGGLLPFNYPPYFALLLLPLAYLPLPSAFALWTAGSIVGLAGIAYLVYQETRCWAHCDRWLMISAILALPALLRTILQGTSSALALVLLLLIYRSLKGRNLVAGALSLAVGTIRPQAILPIGLFAVYQRRWRLVATSVIALVVICGLTTAVFGPRIWLDFILTVVNTGRLVDELGVYPEEMINLRGVLTLWLGSEGSTLVNTLSRVGFLCFVLIVSWLWWRRISLAEPDSDLKLALGLVLGYLFSLHLNPHDGLLLSLPLLLLARYLRTQQKPASAIMTVIGLLPICLLLFDFLVDDFLRIRGSTLLMLGLGLSLAGLLRTSDMERSSVT